MAQARSARSKTIRTTAAEGQQYLARCISLTGAAADIACVRDKTILGDCISVMRLLPPESVDLIVADPPYNLTKTFGTRTFARQTVSAYEAYTRRWLEPACALLKQTGSIYVCCDWQTSLVIGRVLSDCAQVRNRITWQREKGRGAKANWKNALEDIWFATKSDTYTFNLNAVKIRKKVIAPYRIGSEPKDWRSDGSGGRWRDTCPSNFWDDITIPFWSMPENTAHPAQKPEKLLAKIILASSRAGDLVLDPFLGSGTTSVAAKKLGRHYVGIEREEQYCVWAEERLMNAEAHPEIQGYTDGVFWERNTRAEQNRKNTGR